MQLDEGCSNTHQQHLAPAMTSNTNALQARIVPFLTAWEDVLPKGLVGDLQHDPRLLTCQNLLEPLCQNFLDFNPLDIDIQHFL